MTTNTAPFRIKTRPRRTLDGELLALAALTVTLIPIVAAALVVWR